MRPGRPPLPLALLTAVIAAVTTWAALMSWRAFITRPSDFLAPLLIAGLLIAASGAVLRSLRVPGVLVVGAQGVVGLGFVLQHLTGSLMPSPENLDAVRSVLSIATETARTYEAPISTAVPPVAPLLLVCGIAFLLLVDLIACTLHKVPAAGLALLAVYSVPAGLTEAGPGGLAFVGAAAGFLALLHLDARDGLMRWGRALGADEASPWFESNPVREAARAGAGRIGVAATALALVLPVFVPVLDLDIFGIGPGDGDGDVEITNPTVDMRRDLEREEDEPWLRVTTDDPDLDYLRIATLQRFTGDLWSPGNRDNDGSASGDLPDPPGLSDSVPMERYDYDVEAYDEFDSRWLPITYPAASVDADDGWTYDSATLDLLGWEEDRRAAGTSYSFEGLVPDYGDSGFYFQNSASTAVDSELLDVPDSVPDIVAEYAAQVTSKATSDYERAVALQQFFRTDGNFTYNIEKAPPGVGGGTFDTFLTEGPGGRIGYCEQFASAMAAMARTLGIPARVSIGFLNPTKIGADTYEFSSHDMHAWPELYFAGAGWVMFEPTPPTAGPNTPDTTRPDYTRIHVDEGEVEPSESPSQPEGSLRPTDQPSASPTTTPEERTNDRTEADTSSGLDVGTILVAVVLALALVGLLALMVLAPRRLRERARSRRLAGGPAEVWEELWATAIDLRLPWPDDRSPRQVGAALREHVLGLGPDLDFLVSAVERARYARPDADLHAASAELTVAAEACLEAMVASADPKVRRRATWLPRSLFHGPGKATSASPDDSQLTPTG